MDIRKFLSGYQTADVSELADIAKFKVFLDKFGDNIWTRENTDGHVCASAWVVNKNRSKVLMAYHNIYKTYAWLGGHADGERDLLGVAIREAQEESGIQDLKILNNGQPIDIVAHDVAAHEKRGKLVAAHTHYNLTYLLEGDDTQPTRIQAVENSAVEWLPVNKIASYVTDPFIRSMSERIISKIK